MARGNWLLLHLVTSFTVIGPLVTALVTGEWFIVLSLTNSFKLGLTNDCDEWGCSEISYQKLADYSAGVCNRGVKEVESRIVASRTLLILSIVLVALQAFFGLVLWGTNAFYLSTYLVHVLLSSLSFLCALAVVLVFGVTVESWLFCGETYCGFIDAEGQSCSNYVGYSYVALGCGACLLFVALLSLLVSMCLRTEYELVTTTTTVIKQQRRSRAYASAPTWDPPVAPRTPYDRDSNGRLNVEDHRGSTMEYSPSRGEPFGYDGHNNTRLRRKGYAHSPSSSPLSPRTEGEDNGYMYHTTTHPTDDYDVSISRRENTQVRRRTAVSTRGIASSYTPRGADDARESPRASGRSSPTSSPSATDGRDNYRYDYNERRAGSPSRSSSVASKGGGANRARRGGDGVLPPTADRRGGDGVLPPTADPPGGHRSGRQGGEEEEEEDGYNYDNDKQAENEDGEVAAEMDEGPFELFEELREGDWVYEESNGYFWSEEQQMYFEPRSQKFYDPEGDAWYDPDKEEWVSAQQEVDYHGEEQQEEEEEAPF